MKSRSIRTAAALVLLGCGHSDAFVAAASAVGPFNTGTDIRLTVNAEQDYWPAWTGDGRGILYSFVNPVAAGIAASRHRCMGILPAAGGTRVWQLCDDRATQTDTVSSFTAYALAPDGRLLYVEAVASAQFPSIPSQITLWLADTAKPFERTALLTLPVTAGSLVTWLAEIRWTGPNSCMALGQALGTFPACGSCFAADSLFADSTFAGGVAAASGTVVIGAIAGTHATVQAVSGTAGAVEYSLAENGASIVFIHRDDTRLYKVPATGGTAAVVATVTAQGSQLLGVSCKGSTCVVANDPVTPSFGGNSGGPIFASVRSGPRELHSVSLSDGTVGTIRTFGPSAAVPIIASPQISPTTGDVVVQIGGVWGHLQTNTAGGGPSDLHLYPSIVP